MDKIEMTQAELDAQISKAVDSALSKRQAVHEADLARKVEEARKEGAEMAQLTERERAEKEFADREASLVAKEKEMRVAELTNNVKSKLSEFGLPQSLATSMVALGDNDAINDAITAVKADHDAILENALKESVRQGTPIEGANGDTGKQKETGIAEKAKQARII